MHSKYASDNGQWFTKLLCFALDSFAEKKWGKSELGDSRVRGQLGQLADSHSAAVLKWHLLTSHWSSAEFGTCPLGRIGSLVNLVSQQNSVGM